ncbi:MAG: hypothetical protein OJF55_000878 [Rhodanobacteraceae bacterium]|jgi:hypothetical protein|nr:MAG: hypothetical protein OJF55_000878 [Rhodanobacteraceae bacterium]
MSGERVMESEILQRRSSKRVGTLMREWCLCCLANRGKIGTLEPHTGIQQ